MTNGPAGPETPDPLFSLFICFFSLFSMYVRVRSRAYMPDMSKNREAYKAKFFGREKEINGGYIGLVRERERQDTFGSDYITSG